MATLKQLESQLKTLYSKKIKAVVKIANWDLKAKEEFGALNVEIQTVESDMVNWRYTTRDSTFDRRNKWLNSW